MFDYTSVGVGVIGLFQMKRGKLPSSLWKYRVTEGFYFGY